jgi:putative hydrolase of the HAD superfamily
MSFKLKADRTRAQSISMVRGVLFDLFHTLTGSESDWPDFPATADVLGLPRADWDAALHHSSRWRLSGEVADPREIVKRLASQLSLAIEDNLVDRAVAARTARFRHALSSVPRENIDLIRRLRSSGIRTGLVSNADALEIGSYKSSALAGLFDAEVFSCEVGMVKPEAGIYVHALKRIGLAAAECLFVGDGGSDELEGARAVGLRTVFVSGVISELWPDKVERRGRHADFQVAAVSQLLELPLFGPIR